MTPFEEALDRLDTASFVLRSEMNALVAVEAQLAALGVEAVQERARGVPIPEAIRTAAPLVARRAELRASVRARWSAADLAYIEAWDAAVAESENGGDLSTRSSEGGER